MKQIHLAFSTANLGIICSSANNFPKALECFHQSQHWWEAHFSSKGETPSYTTSLLVSEARCRIGLNQFDRAEEMLNMVITQVTEEKPLNFGTLA